VLSDRTSSALTGIAKATLKSGVRVKHLFRVMTHYPELWMQAYANIYANDGATTPGVDGTTMDGMSRDRIENLIKLLRDGKYAPKPTRRTYIPKKNGKMRPLGIPSANDKLVQEVARILLGQIYEPVFSQHSHGFRPKRSCHTALQDVSVRWKGIKWVVDMDIKGFFDNIDHQVVIKCLESKIDDPKFIDLIRQMLSAGYLENWKFHDTYSGTPQGGIVSPILANVVLHELDQFMVEKQRMFNKGERRAENRDYNLLTGKITVLRRAIDRERERGCFEFLTDDIHKQIKQLEEQRKPLSYQVMDDPNFRRLHYVRYADDFAIGLICSMEEAEVIYKEVESFLRERLNLQVAEEKSGVRHIKRGFDFLGHHISLNVHNQRRRKVRCGRTKKGRNTYQTKASHRAQLFLQIPKEKVWEFCKKKGYLKGNRPTSRPELLHLSDFEIVSTFNAEMRGFANYYCLAPMRNLGILEWAGLHSLFRTLAHKHRIRTPEVRRRMKLADDHVLRYEHRGEKKVLKVFKLKYRKTIPQHWDREMDTVLFTANKTEILERMNADKCEYCGKTDGKFEVHHVRKLKDIKDKKKKASWEIQMIARNRKTMVLCTECHDLLHAGKLQGWRRNVNQKTENGEPDAMKVASPVRRGVHVSTTRKEGP